MHYECYWYAHEREFAFERFTRLYTHTQGSMIELMNHQNQAALAALIHAIDLRHQEPLCDVMYDDFQDELW